MPLFPFLILLLPSLALSAPFKVLQEDCSEIDLRERFGPNRDQGSSEFCFAFVAADLIGEAIRLPPSQKISALGVAVSYMSMDREDFRQSQRRVNFENAAPMFSRKFSLPGQNLAVRMEKGGNVEIAKIGRAHV